MSVTAGWQGGKDGKDVWWCTAILVEFYHIYFARLISCHEFPIVWCHKMQYMSLIVQGNIILYIFW
jgi:hypothetical protein